MHRIALPLTLAVSLAACGGLPSPPANMPPTIPLSELEPATDDPFSALAEVDGTPSVSASTVRKGEVLATIPIRYRHTAVLTQDVKGYSITVSGTRVAAGAPGYYVGNFGSTGGYGRTSEVSDMWCFFREAKENGDPDPLCLLRNQTGIAAIAPTRLSPYYWTSFSPLSGSFNYVHTPIFERREVAMPVSLALEYRFEGWDEGVPEVDLFIRDKKARTLRGTPAGSGSFTIPTIAGPMQIAPVAGDPAAAKVSL